MPLYEQVDSEAAAWVKLMELPHVGERVATRIGDRARTRRLRLAEVLRLPSAVLQDEYGLPARAVERLTRDRQAHEAHCQQIITRLRAAGARISHPACPSYPRRWLARLRCPPPLVYLHGNATALNGPTLAILNSRTVTERTVTTAVQIVQHAHRDGFAFVSGGMKSTHRIAAVTIRATGAPRAVVLDRGLFSAFGRRLALDPSASGPSLLPRSGPRHRAVPVPAARSRCA